MARTTLLEGALSAVTMNFLSAETHVAEIALQWPWSSNCVRFS
jgi:hypothetical protein